MTKDQIIDFCLDNHHLTEKELNKKLIQHLQPSEVAEEYDHSKTSLMDACGLSKSKNINKDGFQLSMEHAESGSEIVEYIENKYSKRELSYITFQLINANTKLTKIIKYLK
jgi:hypothetical protein